MQEQTRQSTRLRLPDFDLDLDLCRNYISLQNHRLFALPTTATPTQPTPEEAAAAEAEEAQKANETARPNAPASQVPKPKATTGILKNAVGLPKKKAKPKMTAKERRERSVS